MVNKRGTSGSLVRIFVRIGALRRFHLLTRKTEDLPVEVAWDRRRNDRSDAAGNPSGGPDRRQKPPYTWEVADFVVVENPPAGQDIPPEKP
jgi:hypothetical protein